MTGPVAEVRRTWTSVPTGAEVVPVTRKSPAFQRAVPMVTRGTVFTVGVTVTGDAEAGPVPWAFAAATVMA